MPETLEKPPGQLPNPVIGEGMEGMTESLKQMAAKFRQEYQPLPPGTEKPNPTPQMRQEKPPEQKAPEQPAAPAAPPMAPPAPTAPTTEIPKPADGTPEPPPLDERTLSSTARLHFQRLGQSAAHYNKLATELAKAKEESEAKVKAMEQEIAKFKGIPVDPEQIKKAIEDRERLTKEHEDLIGRIETISLERSPRFQNWWQTETKKHLDIVRRLAPEGKREELEKLVMEPVSNARNEAIDAILEAAPKTNQRMIERAWENLEAIKAQREEALTKGSERYREMQEFERQEKLREDQNKQQRVSQLTAKALTLAGALPSFQESPSDTAHNADVAMRKRFVEGALQGRLDEDLMVALPAHAAHGLYLEEKVIPALKADLAKANELIKQLQSSSPRPSEGGSAPRTNVSTAAPGTEFATKVREAMTGR